ncbi:MAG: hypothetical protein R2911_46465 [Caldilineaceae bacterium]
MSELALAEIVNRVAQFAIFIPERKLDFLLGEIKSGPAVQKSAQRGYDFMVKLGLSRDGLRTVLEEQITVPGLEERAIAIRENAFGGPLLNVRGVVVGLTNTRAYLVSS